MNSQPFILAAFKLGVWPQAGCPAFTCPGPRGVTESPQASRRTTGLDQAVKPGCSDPGQGIPAAQAKPASLSDPKLPAHPLRRPRALPSGDWQGAGPLMAYQELAPWQVPHTLKA